MRAIARARFRLWQKWQWWKHTAWFQFAHGPLCDRFGHNALRLGSWRICRSCALLYLAMAITLGVLVIARPSPWWLTTIGFGLLGPLLLLSWPGLYRHFSRGIKDVLRFGSGVTLATLAALFFTSWWWLATITFCVLYVMFRIYRIKRRAVKSTECEGCPELGQNCACSGYGQQVDSIRKYRDTMDEVLNQPAVASLMVLPTLPQRPIRGERGE